MSSERIALRRIRRQARHESGATPQPTETLRCHDVVMPGSQSAAVEDFDSFYARSFADAARLGHLLTGSVAAGHDAAQDALEAMHKRWDVINNPDGYLRSAVVNRAKNVHRRRARELAFLRRRPATVTTAIPELDETWRVLRRLPPTPRAVVVLRFYEDLSIAEIATELGMPEGTVKSTLHRSLRQLEDLLS